jgi:hypothetical protein
MRQGQGENREGGVRRKKEKACIKIATPDVETTEPQILHLELGL